MEMPENADPCHCTSFDKEFNVAPGHSAGSVPVILFYGRSFFLLNTSYRLRPVPDFEKIMLQLGWNNALVSYPPDHEPRRHSLNGLGADIIFELTKKLTFSAGYAYGVEAPRHGGYGGHEINLLVEWKL